MFGIGVPELILILIVGLVVFGPGKLPEIARSVGKGVREFKKATNAFSQAINAPMETPVQQQSTQPVQQQPVQTQTAPPSHQSMEVSAQQAATTPNITPEAGPAPAPKPTYEAPTQESVRQQIAEQAAKKTDA